MIKVNKSLLVLLSILIILLCILFYINKVSSNVKEGLSRRQRRQRNRRKRNRAIRFEKINAQKSALTQTKLNFEDNPQSTGTVNSNTEQN